MKADALVLTKPRALERRTLAVPPVDATPESFGSRRAGSAEPITSSTAVTYQRASPSSRDMKSSVSLRQSVTPQARVGVCRQVIGLRSRFFDRAGSATRAAEVSIAGARATDWPRCSASST